MPYQYGVDARRGFDEAGARTEGRSASGIGTAAWRRSAERGRSRAHAMPTALSAEYLGRGEGVAACPGGSLCDHWSEQKPAQAQGKRSFKVARPALASTSTKNCSWPGGKSENRRRQSKMSSGAHACHSRGRGAPRAAAAAVTCTPLY